MHCIQQRAKELNACFTIDKDINERSVSQKLEVKLLHALNQMVTLHESLHFTDGDTVMVKISGYGTGFGSRLKVTVIGCMIKFQDFQYSDHVIALVRQPEKYMLLKPTLSNVVEKMKNLKSIQFQGKKLHLKFCFCADLKFMNELMGIGACSSKFCCVWCKCSSDKFWDVTNDVDLRSMEEICELAKRPGKRIKHFGCTHSPMFPINFDDVIMDPLHMFLRISDQLIRKLVQDLRTKDNVAKNQLNVDKTKCRSIMQFETFINSLGIEWHFMTNKSTGIMEYRDFVGPEHKKIQANINLRELIPWHSKLEQVIELWKNFSEIMKMTKKNCNASELDDFKAMTKQWVKLYAQTYLAMDVTYYMHVMAMHMPQSMSVHGSLSGFSQQTFEKMNDQLKSLYFKASDHKLGNLQAFEQIIQKMNRIAYLLHLHVKENI